MTARKRLEFGVAALHAGVERGKHDAAIGELSSVLGGLKLNCRGQFCRRLSRNFEMKLGGVGVEDPTQRRALRTADQMRGGDVGEWCWQREFAVRRPRADFEENCAGRIGGLNDAAPGGLRRRSG